MSVYRYERVNELNRRAFNMVKPSKKECERVIESMASATDGELDTNLCKLYAYFHGRAKPPKKAKTAFEWVARAVSTDADRPFLQVVKVETDRMVATDGRRLHIARNVDNLKPGKYAADGTYLEPLDGTEIGTFPNIDRVLEQIPAEPTYVFSVAVNDLDAEPESNRVVLQPREDIRIAFNRAYLEQATLNVPIAQICYHGDQKAAVVLGNITPADGALDWKLEAVIMPMLAD